MTLTNYSTHIGTYEEDVFVKQTRKAWSINFWNADLRETFGSRKYNYQPY